MADLIQFFISFGSIWLGTAAAFLVLGIIFYKCGTLKGSLITTGEVVKVETEFPSALDIKLNWDNRTYCKKYQCYVRYVCDGQEYVARSFRAYVRAIYFPGDIVQIKVSDKDKQLVDLIKIVGRRRT